MEWSGILQSALILWDLSICVCVCVGGGGGGCWQWKFSQFCLLITQEAILISQSFHLLMDPGYRESPASQTECSVSAGMWYGTFFFSGGSGHGIKILYILDYEFCWPARHETNIIHAHCVTISWSESTFFKMWLFSRVLRIVISVNKCMKSLPV